MADHQKIHPVDPEAPPLSKVPLVPRNTSRSENGDPDDKQYPAAPFGHNIPVVHSKPPKKRRSCCCRCLCWTVSLFILLVIVVGIVGGILFLVFRPKLPKFSINHLQITDFNINNETTSIHAKFDVTITSRNPNKRIGIYYEKGSHLSVWYTDTKLCEGSLPIFYQGHRNTTVFDVALTGQIQNGTSLLTALSSEQQQTGIIPLNLKATVPVRIKLGKLKLMKMKFRVRCKLGVDSLNENNSISIRTSSCKFRFRL